MSRERVYGPDGIGRPKTGGRKQEYPPDEHGNIMCYQCKIYKSPFMFSRRKNAVIRLCRSYECKLCTSINKKEAYSLGGSYTSEMKNRVLLRSYGITLKEFDKMRFIQDYTCAICHTDEDDSHKGLHIDHDHSCCPTMPTCGKCNRGLLCNNCNRGTGLLKDNVDILQSAIEYITSFKSTKVKEM